MKEDFSVVHSGTPSFLQVAFDLQKHSETCMLFASTWLRSVATKQLTHVAVFVFCAVNLRNWVTLHLFSADIVSFSLVRFFFRQCY